VSICAYKTPLKERASNNVEGGMTSRFGRLKSFLVSDSSRLVGNVASIIVDNLDFVPNNAKNLLFKLADSSDTATDILRTAISNFDKIPANFRTDLIIKAASHVGNDPKLAALAETLIRNSPEIAATVVGCTPLAPFSIIIRGVAENMVKKRLDEGSKVERKSKEDISDLSEQLTKLMQEIEILKGQK
jgi:hypothetical protein